MRDLSVLYTVVIMCASISLAILTSARTAYVMAKRWRFGGEPTFFFVASSAIAAGAAMGFTTFAAIFYVGLVAGLLSAVLSVPLTGVCWFFIIGANKAIERIINSLLAKVSA